MLAPLTDADLGAVKYYASYPAKVAGRRVLLARTGYTGEDGFELFARPDDAEPLWAALTAAGAGDGLVPAGLAARDTLRLEEAMPLYGNRAGPRADARTTPNSGELVRLDKRLLTSSAGQRSPSARPRHRSGAWSASSASPGGCPGTGMRCSGTAPCAAPSPAAHPRRPSARRSRWPTSGPTSRRRPSTTAAQATARDRRRRPAGQAIGRRPRPARAGQTCEAPVLTPPGLTGPAH